MAPVEILRVKISQLPRIAGAAKEPAGQMTIFYCGQVNVYDDMPGCKVIYLLFLIVQMLYVVILTYNGFAG